MAIWLKTMFFSLQRMPLIVLLTFLGLAGAVTPAHASTIVAPVGGNAIPLGARRVVCASPNDMQGWSIIPGGRKVKPPTQTGMQPIDIKIAADLASCVNKTDTLSLVAVDAWPSIDLPSVILRVDAGRVDVSGRNLRGVSMSWKAGGKSGSDACHDPQINRDKSEACAFSIEREISANPSEIALSFLPSGIPTGDDVITYNAMGRRIRLDQFNITPAKIVVLNLLPDDTAMDAEIDTVHLPLKHAEAISSVECSDAMCEISGTDLLVRNVRSSDENLNVQINLRPHVYVQEKNQLSNTATTTVGIRRCPVSLASSLPLRNIVGQNVVLKVGGRCKQEKGLRFFVSGNPAKIIDSYQNDDYTYNVIHLENAPTNDLNISMQRNNSIVGSVKIMTRAAPSLHALFELPDFGFIDFIPSNRNAKLSLPPMSDGGALVPIPVDGVYTVQTDDKGAYHVRGLASTTGWISLRLAYRDKSLPLPLRDTNLAELTEAVERSIHPASIPIPLATQSISDKPLLELTCGDKKGSIKKIIPGQATAVPFYDRDTCRLILHRERLSPEDGDQALNVAVNVVGSDGITRNESTINQRIILKAGSEPKYMYINGVAAPFDRVIVRVSLLSDDSRYAVAADDKLNAPQVQWSIIMGTNKLRLFATAALPTGLFRVADRNHSGLYGLNAGVLMRLVGLTPDGFEIPVGLEAGVVVVGITGDSTPSPNGHLALVSGLSISIPIANWGRVSQAAISLHMLAEYEVTRAFMHNAGTPWGFIFGPSISLGNVGYNL